VDLLDVLERDTRLRRVSRRDGGEWAGPCPFCGGDDRFRVWPEAEPPRFWCRRCGRRGDAISYLREHDGLSYRDACAALGLDPDRPRAPSAGNAGGTGPHHRPTRTPLPFAFNVSGPNERWRAAAAAFCRQAEEALWSERGRAAREYLYGRGLRDLGMRVSLGLNLVAREEPAARWGLDDGAPVRLPAGIVIPCKVEYDIWRVIVRRFSGEPRYLTVRGSVSVPYGLNTLRAEQPAMLLESELDALLVAQEAREALSTLATGSTTGARSLYWQMALARATEVLVAFDSDEAGEAAARWWLEALPNARRWAPPLKDPGEMHRHGLSVADWVSLGLAAPMTV